jgi:hypothetical protein
MNDNATRGIGAAFQNTRTEPRRRPPIDPKVRLQALREARHDATAKALDLLAAARTIGDMIRESEEAELAALQGPLAEVRA